MQFRYSKPKTLIEGSPPCVFIEPIMLLQYKTAPPLLFLGYLTLYSIAGLLLSTVQTVQCSTVNLPVSCSAAGNAMTHFHGDTITVG